MKPHDKTRHVTSIETTLASESQSSLKGQGKASINARERRKERDEMMRLTA